MIGMAVETFWISRRNDKNFVKISRKDWVWQNVSINHWVRVGHGRQIPYKINCRMFLTGTADPWGERSWSRFSAYSMFVKDLDKLNLGQELHGNRFCDFEKRCAIGIYSIEIWVCFTKLRTEARNNLAIFLRDTQHLKDIYILLWLGPALLGIHLREP